MSLTALEIFSVLMRKIKQVLSTNKKFFVFVYDN